MILESILKQDKKGLFEKISNKFEALIAEVIEEVREFASDDAILEARFKIVNRVRNGKVQRRRKVSQVKGYRFQDGKLVRMSAREKLNRKRSQRKGAIKRKSKVAGALRRRKISIRKRGAI
jgi:hypothetical protein